MKRKSFLFLLIFFSAWSLSFAQSGSMTDNQVVSFIMAQREQGVPQSSIIQKLMQKGVTVEQLRRVRKNYQSQQEQFGQVGQVDTKDVTKNRQRVNRQMRETQTQNSNLVEPLNSNGTKVNQQYTREETQDLFSDELTFLDIDSVRYHQNLLKEYNRRWYLIAAAEEGGKLLNFALDRIDKVVPLPSHVYVPYDGDLNERFEDIVGVTLNEDKDLQTIVFWVSNRSKDYVATKPIHESQRNIRGEREKVLREKYPTLCEGRFFSIDCIENYELIRELTSFGKDLIVLSPQSIVEQVQQRITEMHNEYSAVFKKDKS